MKHIFVKHIFLQAIFLFLSLSVHLYASNKKFADTLSVEYLIYQADSLFNDHPSAAGKYAQKALETAISNGNERGQFDAYYQLARVNFRYGNKLEAIEFIKLAEAGYIKLNNRYALASLYHTWANGLFILGEIEESDFYSDKSIALALASGNNVVLGLQYYTRATKAERNNDIFLAIDYLNKALNIPGTGKEMEKMRTRCYGDLGSIYGDMNELEKGISYKLTAAQKFDKYNMHNAAGYEYAAVGNYYRQLMNYDSAHFYLYKARNISNRFGAGYTNKSAVYRYIATYFLALNHTDSAIFYVNKCIEIGEEHDLKKSLPIYYDLAAQIFYENEDHNKAIHYGKMAVKISKEQNIPVLIANSEKFLGHTYYHIGQSDSAAHYYNQYIRSDTLNSLAKIRKDILKLSELRIRKQTEQKLQEEALKRKILLFILLGSVAATCVLMILLWKILKQRDKIRSINADLNEHKEELKQLLEYKGRILNDKEEQYRSLCNNMVGGAVFRAEFEETARAETGRIVFVSSGWEDMSGKPYDPEDSSLRRFFENTWLKDQIILKSAVNEALENLSVIDVAFRYQKGEESIWLRLRAAATKNDAGPIYIDGYLFDETERILSEKKLIAAKEKAEESDQLKTAFFNNISHEIRTPLNAILGFSQLFDNPDITANQREMMSVLVKSNADQLTKMVEDIIMLSEIDSNTLVVMLQKGNIYELLDRIMTESNNKAKAIGKTKLEIMMDNRIPETLKTITIDERKVSRILMHLMENAIKYTDRGYVMLGCEACTVDKTLHFRVEDTGSGIEKEHLEKIFIRFWKRKDKSREFRGLGIGLPLCMELAKLMDGYITTESKTGYGSTFSVTFKYQ